LQSWQKESKN